MEHPRIDDDLVAERYVVGNLSPEEGAAFEEHFFECARCLDSVEDVRRFREDLREVAGEFRTAPKTIPGWRRSASMLLAASWVAAVGVSAYFFVQERGTRRELAASRAASELANRRAAAIPPPHAPAAVPLPVAASVLVLNRTRGDESAAPDASFSLSRSASWIVLLVDLPDGTTARECRVRLSSGDRQIAPPLDAAATPEGMLAVSVPAGLLTPGDYALAVEGAGSRLLATYRFRALP